MVVATKKKGDRNFWQETRLLGICPKHGKSKCAQTVDRGKDYGLIKHWCPICGRLLHVQRYPLNKIKEVAKRWI